MNYSNPDDYRQIKERLSILGEPGVMEALEAIRNHLADQWILETFKRPAKTNADLLTAKVRIEGMAQGLDSFLSQLKALIPSSEEFPPAPGDET